MHRRHLWSVHLLKKVEKMGIPGGVEAGEATHEDVLEDVADARAARQL